jgi:hypothetical protein
MWGANSTITNQSNNPNSKESAKMMNWKPVVSALREKKFSVTTAHTSGSAMFWKSKGGITVLNLQSFSGKCKKKYGRSWF